MSVQGQNRKCLRRRGTSVLPPTADMRTPTAQDRFVPNAAVRHVDAVESLLSTLGATLIEPNLRHWVNAVIEWMTTLFHTKTTMQLCIGATEYCRGGVD
jgi:hypothetical protein